MDSNSSPFSDLFSKQKLFFGSGATRSLKFRQEQLRKLAQSLTAHEDLIVQALAKDLGKPKLESITAELDFILSEIKYAEKNLCCWMKPRRVSTPMHLWPGKTRVISEPLGVALIIGPWNYPIQLALTPLIGSISAGNCSIVKPSELAPHSVKVMAKILGVFDPEYIALAEGGIPETTDLLDLPFNHIFFTGSTKVGKIVYQAAARHLTPVTLELGGKSPAIVCEDADLDLAARRIAWGKFSNSGQTCVAPDYVYADRKIATALMAKIKQNIFNFYGERSQESPSFGRIINIANHRRLMTMLDKSKLYCGGANSEKDLFIEPTILRSVSWSDPVMQEEIFGPILPVVEFDHLDSALDEIKKRDKPLAAYLFSQNSKARDQFLKLSFGGGCINDTVVHLSNLEAPFGGVGASGLGAYHGDKSFAIFSHQKTVLTKSRWFDVSIRYPPYSDSKLAWLRRLMG